MKKILVLSFYYHPDLCAGSFRCTSLVEQLAKKEVNIHVITTCPNRYESYNIEEKRFYQKGNITINRIPLPNHKSGMIDQMIAFYVFFRGAKKLALKKDYDIVFATSSRLFTGFLGARISKKMDIPLYLDIRDLFVDTISNIFSPKLGYIFKPILSLIEKYTFTSAKKINLVSKGFDPYFKEKFPDINCSYFTNGIDREFIEVSNDNNSEQNHKQSTNKVTILYAGNIGEGQGLHKIIPMMAANLKDEIYFRVIGAGGLSKKLKARLKELNLKNVEIVAPMKRESLIKEYMKADVLFLHLNDLDAFKKVLPSKLFEYAATNKPILAGVSGYSKNFILSEISNCEVFIPANYKDAIKKLANLKNSDNPRSKFIEKYKREKIMKKMAEDINELI